MESIRLQNDRVRIEVVPELGCKIISIHDIAHDYEWLWKDPTRPLRPATFGELYQDFDISGFDECFPNIGISSYPLDSTLTLPDHGDLWSIPWTVRTEGLSLIAEVKGRSLPYVFSRTIELNGPRVTFKYHVRNEKDSEIAFIWSAHPLFKVSGDMRILLNETPEMTKEFGFGGRLGPDGLDGYLGKYRSYLWPHALSENGKKVDLSFVTLEKSVTDKVILNSPLDGRLSLKDSDSGRSLSFQYSPVEIPYLGICFNLGAWPFNDNPGTWVAIEPTTGCTDKLDESLARGIASSLAPGEVKSWGFEIELK